MVNEEFFARLLSPGQMRDLRHQLDSWNDPSEHNCVLKNRWQLQVPIVEKAYTGTILTAEEVEAGIRVRRECNMYQVSTLFAADSCRTRALCTPPWCSRDGSGCPKNVNNMYGALATSQIEKRFLSKIHVRRKLGGHFREITQWTGSITAFTALSSPCLNRVQQFCDKKRFVENEFRHVSL